MGHGGQFDVRHLLATSLVLAFVTAVALLGAAVSATAGARAHRAVASAAVVAAVADYRQLTWTYDRIAPVRPTARLRALKRAAPATPGAVLDLWKHRADAARRVALATLRRTIGVRLPVPPSLRASPRRQRAYSEHLALTLERIFPLPVSSARSLASAHARIPTLAFWQSRAAATALAIARYAPRPLFIRDRLFGELLCIHRREGRWTSNTGNGYYGGLQMDLRFQSTFGQAFLVRWGTADNWPVWAQVAVARRAYLNGLGFTPWPNTRRACGL
jgi:hypothetical protein